MFGDSSWSLTPALFEAHASPVRLHFTDVPARFVLAAKTYCWLLLNYERPMRTRRTNLARLSINTIRECLPAIKPFFAWLDESAMLSPPSLSADDFDAYLDFVVGAYAGTEKRRRCIVEVQRYWAYRTLLPHDDQLPETPPWDGEPAVNLTGTRLRYSATENTTARIPETVMQPMLQWSIRFVEDFAEDIIAAYHEWVRLCNRNVRARRARLSPPTRRYGSARALRNAVTALLDQYRSAGRPLPGRRNVAGQLEVDLYHLGRELDCNLTGLFQQADWISAKASSYFLSLADGAPLHDRITGRIDDAPWRETPITYRKTLELAQHLSTAVFIMVSYLSGMRVGEALNLVRDCAVHDRTGLDFIYGRAFKAARSPHGTKLVEGAERRIPWTVIPLVVRAIDTIESLHKETLLFPVSLQTNGRVPYMRGQGKQARRPSLMGRDIRRFIAWVNTYCEQHDRQDRILPDPAGLAISPSRFRRTLAWFIWHRPRGAVAAAIQYGHVHVRITQGYTGTAASGFPSDYAFEEFLGHYAQLMEDARRLSQGEHVSGPAADRYRERIASASQRFGGRVIPTQRQALSALNRPELQVFHGEAMTCVFDRRTALCELRALSDDPRRTPDLDNCRSHCRNIARTDRDIQQLRLQHASYQADVDSPLTPEPLRLRAEALAARLRATIDAHEEQRTSSVKEEDE